MILYQAKFLSEGAFADVFVGESNDRVLKIFASPTHVKKRHPPNDEKRRRDTFESECAAYEIAASQTELSRHVPTFYGRVPVTDVIGRDGKSVKDQYLLDCCYEMERVFGDPPVKIGACPDDFYPHIAAARTTFISAGIYHIGDSSVFFADDAERFIVIDFATREYELMW